MFINCAKFRTLVSNTRGPVSSQTPVCHSDSVSHRAVSGGWAVTGLLPECAKADNLQCMSRNWPHLVNLVIKNLQLKCLAVSQHFSKYALFWVPGQLTSLTSVCLNCIRCFPLVYSPCLFMDHGARTRTGRQACIHSVWFGSGAKSLPFPLIPVLMLS